MIGTRQLLLAALFAACAIARAQEVVTSVPDLLALGPSTEEARPAVLRGVCTYPKTTGEHFYLHDGKAGTTVRLANRNLCPRFGDEVEAKGVTSLIAGQIGIAASEVRVLGQGTLPEPERIALGHANPGRYFAHWVEAEGVVLNARGSGKGAFELQLADASGLARVSVIGEPQVGDWDGARVRVRALHAGGPPVHLFAGASTLLTVLSTGRADPFTAPVADAMELRRRSPEAGRVKLTGTVLDTRFGVAWLRSGTTTFQADPPALLEASEKKWTVVTPKVSAPKLRPGDEVEVVGSPLRTGAALTLFHSQMRVLKSGEPPEPHVVRLSALGDAVSDLVTVRARMLDYTSSAIANKRWRETLKLEQNGQQLEVVHEALDARGAFAGFKADDLIEATGIVRHEDGTPPFRLRLRTAGDIRSLGLAPEIMRARQLRQWSAVAAIGLAALACIVILKRKLSREHALSAERGRAAAQVSELNAALERRVAERTADLDAALAREREAGEIKSRFTSLASHEFRTPLGLIGSSAQILDRYFTRLEEGERREHLDAITANVKRMGAMMEEILVLSRMDAGRMEFKPAPFSLGDFCRRLLDDLRSAHGGTVDFQTEASAESTALADENLLRYILTNLLTNAHKYSPQGAPVHLILARENGTAIFTIRDEGIGIPGADQPHLFEAFHRGTNVGTVSGTGLGLVIVRRCCELHGGSVSVASREGAGTTVTVRLPVFGDPQPEPSGARQTAEGSPEGNAGGPNQIQNPI